ncbi:MAG: hypothetical protein WC856_10085 [Methylococcaceae bacterium]|jgi:hypothetical protein
MNNTVSNLPQKEDISDPAELARICNAYNRYVECYNAGVKILNCVEYKRGKKAEDKALTKNALKGIPKLGIGVLYSEHPNCFSFRIVSENFIYCGGIVTNVYCLTMKKGFSIFRRECSMLKSTIASDQILWAVKMPIAEEEFKDLSKQFGYDLFEKTREREELEHSKDQTLYSVLI